MKCDKCLVDLPENDDFVKCSLCNKSYHYNCSVRETKWRNLSAELKNKWVCILCKDNTNSTNSSQGDGESVPEDDVSTKALLLHMNSRLNVLDEVKKSVDEMTTSISFLSNKYDELLKEIKVYKEENKELKASVSKLKAAHEEKDKALTELTRRFNSLEQYGRGLNLEIHGLDMHEEGEHSEEVVQQVAKALQQPFNSWEIQAAHRLPSRNQHRPPALLIQFVSKAVKQRWLLAGKRSRLYSKNIVGVGEQRVFFNENLTPHYGRLFQETRKVAKEKKYESVWVMNGTIRVKKTRNDRRTLVISEYEDLKLLT